MGKLPTISLEITNQSRQHSLWMLVKAHRTNKGDWLKVFILFWFPSLLVHTHSACLITITKLCHKFLSYRQTGVYIISYNYIEL